MENSTDFVAENTSAANESAGPLPSYLAHSGQSRVAAFGLLEMVLICSFLSVVILLTIVGNVFVISAIVLEKSLQGVSNYLIMSLAVTDLMVAVLVMPISVVNEVSVNWYLGPVLCDAWISFDVLCCTASILHLVAIATDRFWAVSNIDYIRKRSLRKILTMVASVWVVSVTISIPPLFGWKDNQNSVNETGKCMISQDLGYTIFSTVGAFYFPLTLMLILNCKIYKAARSRIRKKNFHANRRHVPVSAITVTATEANFSPNSSGSDISHDPYSAYNGSCINMNEMSRAESTLELREPNGQVVPEPLGHHLKVPEKIYMVAKTPRASNGHHVKRTRQKERDQARKEKIEMKRERKAARVLAIITGAFVLCWLPFFMIAVIGPFCGAYCYFPPAMASVFLWCGYFNSLLNPIIYTIFNPNFRNAFRKLLFGKYRKKVCR